jgi:hypothetical protein
MDEYLLKVPEPMGSFLSKLTELVMTRYPDVLVRHPGKVDTEGWVEFAFSGGAAFAGVRFRRDRSTALTILLAAQPSDDPQQWAHPSVAKGARQPFGFGLPRPFSKDVCDAEWTYALGLIDQSRKAVAEAEGSP